MRQLSEKVQVQMMEIVERWQERIEALMPVDITYRLKAVAKERPRKSGHFYTPKKTQDFEKEIAKITRKFMDRPMTGGLSIKIRIIEAMPKTVKNDPRKLLLARARLLLPTRGDLDNKIKAITDGLNGVAYIDDGQISNIIASRRYGDEDLIAVTIRQIALSPQQVEMALTAMKAMGSGQRKVNKSRP